MSDEKNNQAMKIELPPLPDPYFIRHDTYTYAGSMGGGGGSRAVFMFSADQMREYGKQCAALAPQPTAQQASQGLTLNVSDEQFSKIEAALNKAPQVSQEVVDLLKELRRAIGGHNAPHDCYATGPMTGDEIRDLIQCPACSAITMYDEVMPKVEAALSRMPAKQQEAALSEDRIDWIANSHCPDNRAYPLNVKNAHPVVWAAPKPPIA